MHSLTVSFSAVIVVLCGALLGVVVQRWFFRQTRDSDAKDIAKPAMGLVATLAALVLGLVIATAKSSYDEKSSQIRQMTARIIALDNVLAQYGPEARVLRQQLRVGMGVIADRIWQEGAAARHGPFQASAEALMFLAEIEALPSKTEAQALLRSRAIQALDEIAKARLLLFAQSGSSIPTPFLIILVFWLAALFGSFTMFSKVNPVAFATLAVSALSVGGAIFLLLELDNPFAGLMQIPSSVLRESLGPLGS